jgi:phosphohistidine phosphatase
MRDLVLLRHGHALSLREANVPADSLRPLSELGEREALQTIEHLRAAGFSPKLIISSPYLRAVRTAEIAAAVWPAARRETAQELSDGPVQAIVDLVAPYSPDAILLVGHQPLLGIAAAFFSGEVPFDLSPAGYARVRLGGEDAKSGLLELYAPAAPQGKAR